MDKDEWATFKIVLPYSIYQDLNAAIDMALRMGATGPVEAIALMVAEFRSTWEATEICLSPESPYSQFIRQAFIRDGWKCLLGWPGCSERRNLTCHHILPLSHGGDLLDLDNVATLCNNCHEKVTHGSRETNWRAVRPRLLSAIGIAPRGSIQSCLDEDPETGGTDS